MVKKKEQNKIPSELLDAVYSVIPLTAKELLSKSKTEQEEIFYKYDLDLRSICETDHGYPFNNDDLKNLLEDDKCNECRGLIFANGLDEEEQRAKELESGAEPTEEEIEKFREYCEEMIGSEWETWSKIWSGKITTSDLIKIHVFASSPHSEEFYFEGFFRTAEEGINNFFYG